METNNSISVILPITTIFESALQLKPENRIPLYIYLPDRDSQNQQVDNSEHRDVFIQKFTTWFGGCSVEQTLGFWQGQQVLVCENTLVIMSYVTHEQIINNMEGLKSILDDFYYQSKQETLLIVLGNSVYLYEPTSSGSNLG